jgi:hypothetical protein
MRVPWLALLLLAGLGAPGRAQQHDPPFADSLLREAVRLASEGLGDSARLLLRQRLAALAPTDSLVPQAAFAAGVVASDRDSAAAYFRRVSVEYSNSIWAPAALVRLAQFAFAAGDHRAVLRVADRARLDYPASVQRAAAAFWGARAHLDLGELTAACALLQQAEAEAGDDVELANRARFYLQRCVTITTPATAPAPDTSAAARTPVVYAVQVAAVQSPLAADATMRDLRAAGHEPRVLREADGLFKVRVGRFATRAEAQRVLEQLRRRFGSGPFIVEEPR